MARKSKNTTAASPIGAAGSGGSFSVRVEPVENGAVVHLSSETVGKNPEYSHKTYVAHDHKEARRIALSHVVSLGSRSKAKGKKASRKKTITKR
jgi:hypothetical protein